MKNVVTTIAILCFIGLWFFVAQKPRTTTVMSDDHRAVVILDRKVNNVTIVVDDYTFSYTDLDGVRDIEIVRVIQSVDEPSIPTVVYDEQEPGFLNLGGSWHRIAVPKGTRTSSRLAMSYRLEKYKAH